LWPRSAPATAALAPILAVAFAHGHPLDPPDGPISSLHSRIVGLERNHFRFHRLRVR
jgi:hypothetical protein